MMYDDLGYLDGAIQYHPMIDQAMPPSLVDSSSSNYDCLDPYAAAETGFGRAHHQLGFEYMMHDAEAAATLPQPGSFDMCYNGDLRAAQHRYPAVPDLLNLLELPPCAGNPAVFENSRMSMMLYEQGMGNMNIPAGQLQFEGVVGDYRRSREIIMGNMNIPTERQRRVQMNGKFNALRSLVPLPTKPDRASIISDAIDYIKELLRTVNELKLLVEKKQRGCGCGCERSKRVKEAEEEEEEETAAAAADAAGNMESSRSTTAAASASKLGKAGDEEKSNISCWPLRSSWLQRRSKETFVDVRIMEEEVNIKLTQKKKPDALLFAAAALDELRLHLNHVAGGNIGDYHIFIFNAKICEGSSVYAGAVANKLLEAMARQCMLQNVRP